MARKGPAGPTTAQLRDTIDRGRTGSKAGFQDPAAAPLGTDDEAAGTPPTPEQVRDAMRTEVLSRGRHRPHGRDANAAVGNTDDKPRRPARPENPR